MKKVILIIVGLLFLFTPICFGQLNNIKNDQYNNNNNAIYSYHINGAIYPIIRECLKEINYPPNNEKSQKIATSIQSIIIEYLNRARIVYNEKPMVTVLKYENKKCDVFILEVSISLYDMDDSNPLMSFYIIYNKIFLIHLQTKTTILTEL